MKHLGINIYVWRRQTPIRLITELLAPLFETLQADGSADGLWYTTFDARAPHLFALFAIHEARFEDARRRVEQSVSQYLRHAPFDVDISAEDVAERHRQCRGKVLCAADSIAGAPAPNTFLIFEQGADQYPFSAARNAPEAWSLWSHSLPWCLDRLQEGKGALGAVRWLAAIHRAIDRLAPESAERYWRRHACTLIYPLADRLESAERDVLDSLPSTIGERNHQVFSSIWALDDPVADAAAGAMVRELLAVDAVDRDDRLRLLREINHTTLLQHLQFVRFHIPLVLFAWRQSLQREPRHA